MKFLEFLSESEKIEPKPTLDPSIFDLNQDGDAKLRQSVHVALVHNIDLVDSIVPVMGAYIHGRILTKNYDGGTPVEIYIFIDGTGINEVIQDKLLKTALSFKVQKVSDTMHNAEYEIKFVSSESQMKKIIKSYVGSLFDISKNEWVKYVDESRDDISKFINAVKRNEPKDLVFFSDTENNFPVEYLSVLETYSNTSLKRIVNVLKSRFLDLSVELEKNAVSKDEKAFVKDVNYNNIKEPESIGAMFIKNKISAQVALALLGMRYYKNAISMVENKNEDKIAIRDDSISDIIQKAEDASKDIAKSENGIVPENVENNHGKVTFLEYSELTESKNKIKKLKSLKKLVQAGKASKRPRDKAEMHKDMALQVRNMRRKRLKQVAAYREKMGLPAEEINNMFNCKQEISRLKRQESGIKYITNMQARWVASAYHFDMPDMKDRLKRLSNMPMALYLARNGKFFLIKDKRLAQLT